MRVTEKRNKTCSGQEVSALLLMELAEVAEAHYLWYHSLFVVFGIFLICLCKTTEASHYWYNVPHKRVQHKWVCHFCVQTAPHFDSPLPLTHQLFNTKKQKQTP
jgi:hypothetical protein